jgi:S1-C subfamily serine protease
MKNNCLIFMLLLLLAVVVQLPARQSTNNSPAATNDVASDAIEHIRAKAEKGDVIAQATLGGCYFKGDGVAKDTTEAVKWLSKAANQGNAPSQLLLGSCLVSGNGTPRNIVEGMKWIRSAAELGYARAQDIYAEACRFGVNQLSKDMTEAVKWYRKAAEQGYADSQYHLGGLYFLGDGVPKDYVEAYKWLDLASAQGNDKAKEAVSVLEGVMAQEQIAEGQRLAREFKPRTEGNFTSPENPFASGSGFFITDDGYLISNYHVVKGAAKVRLLTGAGLIDATVVKVDAANDLALLKAVGRFAPLPIAASRTVKLGGTVATVGFPDIGLQGFAPKLAKGEIASLAGAADDPRYFQISLPVQPGNSGGALVDARGNVVGIVAAKLDASAALAATGSLPENVNYAVKSSLLLSFLESVPDVAAKLKEPNVKDESFEEVVKSAQDAAVLVLVY